MSERSFSLEIPVAAWAAENYVPDAAKEAVQLGARLRVERNVMNSLSIACSDLPLNAENLTATATLIYRHGARSFVTLLRVAVEVLDESHHRVARIDTSASVEFGTDEVLEVMEDTAKTFALSFGCLEPMWTVVRTIESALTFLGVDAHVAPDETLEHNRVAVQESSEQPPMSPAEASPLNPYALAGVPGEAAEKLAAHGFAATYAKPWVEIGSNRKMLRGGSTPGSLPLARPSGVLSGTRRTKPPSASRAGSPLATSRRSRTKASTHRPSTN